MPLFCMCTALEVELVEVGESSAPRIGGEFAEYAPVTPVDGRPLVGVYLPESAMRVEKMGANVFTAPVRRDDGPEVGDPAFAHHKRVDIHRCPRCGASVASGG